MIPIIAGLVSMFASKGLDLLAGTAEAVTEKGVDKLTDFIKDKTGLDIKEKLVKKEDLTPEEIQALKELEYKNEEQLRQIKLEYYKLDLQDRADARKLQEKALEQNDIFSKRFLYYYAAAATTLSFTYIFLITFMVIPESNLRFADTILGVVIGTIISTITQFFFGSSAGSKSKETSITETLKSITKK